MFSPHPVSVIYFAIPITFLFLSIELFFVSKLIQYNAIQLFDSLPSALMNVQGHRTFKRGVKNTFERGRLQRPGFFGW